VLWCWITWCPDPAAEGLTYKVVIPVVAGGINHPSNLQALCGVCNLAKGAR
jgi:hypothetical protein